MVQVHDLKPAKLVLLPIGYEGVAQRPFEARHDDRPDLLVEGQSARAQ